VLVLDEHRGEVGRDLEQEVGHEQDTKKGEILLEVLVDRPGSAGARAHTGGQVGEGGEEHHQD